MEKNKGVFQTYPCFERNLSIYLFNYFPNNLDLLISSNEEGMVILL